MIKCNAKAAAVRLLLVVSYVLGTSFGVAGAQDRAPDVREPVLALAVAPDVVPPAALQGALEAELGVRIDLTDAPDPNVPALTVVRLGSGNVEVALASRSIPRASRQLILTAELEQERVETLSLIAANLVRNEAAALLPDLRPAAASVDAATPAPAPKPPEPRVDDPCALGPSIAFGFDFVPGVGTSSSPAGRAATRRFSLGFLGTLQGGVRGAALSIGANVVRKHVCGVQLAVGANLAFGSLSGAQLAQFNLVRGTLVGTQLGTLNLTLGAVNGLQAGLGNGAGDHVGGAQLGIVNYGASSLSGMQGGIANVAAGHVHGAQLGVLNVSTDGFRGAQVGVASLSVGDGHGAQVGVANVNTGSVAAQVGVFNYADSSDASVGVVSIVRRGRTSVDLSGAIESGVLMAGITHGGKYVHNVYGVGLRTDEQGQRLALQYGIGVRVYSGRWLRVDVDAISTHLFRDDGKTSQLAGGRIPVTFMIARGFGAFIAPSYQVMITDDPAENPTPLFGRTVHEGGSHPNDTRVIGYNGLTLGIRYQFDHGA